MLDEGLNVFIESLTHGGGTSSIPVLRQGSQVRQSAFKAIQILLRIMRFGDPIRNHDEHIIRLQPHRVGVIGEII